MIIQWLPVAKGGRLKLIEKGDPELFGVTEIFYLLIVVITCVHTFVRIHQTHLNGCFIVCVQFSIELIFKKFQCFYRLYILTVMSFKLV